MRGSGTKVNVAQGAPYFFRKNTVLPAQSKIPAFYRGFTPTVIYIQPHSGLLLLLIHYYLQKVFFEEVYWLTENLCVPMFSTCLCGKNRN